MFRGRYRSNQTDSLAIQFRNESDEIDLVTRDVVRVHPSLIPDWSGEIASNMQGLWVGCFWRDQLQEIHFPLLLLIDGEEFSKISGTSNLE